MMYLKKYSGLTGDGYPEDRFLLRDELEEFEWLYNTEYREEYFQLIPIPKEKMDIIIATEKQRKMDEKKAREKENDLQLLSDLKKKYES